MLLLRKFLILGIRGDGATVSAYRRPLGYLQVSGTGSAQKLTLPAAIANSGLVVGYAVIQCESASATDFIRWRDDGTAPTSSVGMRLFAQQELDYSGDMTSWQFITGSGSPVLDVSFYA